MNNLIIEQLSFIIPAISIGMLFIITSINLYMKIRKVFPIRVNCWFCNSYANVPYNQFNSWICVHCEQYNGFDKEGDYNCDIPAQRSIQLNKKWRTGETGKQLSYVASTSQRNSLCENCNRNQQIKVQQLALFEPTVKENFDMEIENFREKLEKSYELCCICQRFVKKTLNRTIKNVLGLRLAQIGGKVTAITILSVWNLCNSSKSVHLSKNDFDTHFPPLATHFILLGISFISAVRLVVMEYSSAIVVSIDFDRICSLNAEDYHDFFKLAIDNAYQIDFIINLAAVLLSLKLVLARSSRRLCSLLLMFLWNVNMVWPTIAGFLLNEFAGDLLKILLGVIILIVVIIMNYTLYEEAIYNDQPTNNSFHRIYSNLDDDLSENSDCEAVYNNTDSCSSISTNYLSNLTKSFSPNVSKSTSCLYLSPDLNSTPRSHNQHLSWHKERKQDMSERNIKSNRDYMSPFSIPDDCQNKLTDLNISGISRRNTYTITCSSPTPSILIHDRCRSQLLTPARLKFNDHSQLGLSATKTSWVAGGFFVKNNLSPQKRQQPRSVVLHPISRTSSQSSGFESRPSSVHNEYTSGSRESSIAGDIASNFSEPTQIADSNLNFNFPSNRSLSSITNNRTAFVNNSTLCKPEFEAKYFADDKKLPSSKPVYHQFGTHRHNSSDNVFSNFPHHSRKRNENIIETNSFLYSDDKN